jgi:peptidyl-prolyl cis-trans isomerase C
MHKNRIALALSAALFSAFVCADGASIATVNGVAIPQSKVDMLVKQVAASGQATDTPELRSRIRESLIRNEIVVQEAAKKGLDKDPEVLAQLEMAKSQILSDAFVKDYVKNHPIAETDLKKFYEEQVKPQFAGKEYHARHILVTSEAEAKAILAELKKGKKFDSLAKAKSLDKGSGENGGDLGWSNPNAFVKEFSERASALKMPSIL